MMKKLLYLIFGLMILGGQFAIAQCVPDPQYTEPGIYPDTATGLPCAVNGAFYDEDITLVVPIILPPPVMPFIVDSAVLVSLTGLPPGIGYACGNTLNNSTNSWAGGSAGCINLTGVATTNGTYQILAIVESYLAGVTTPASSENVDYYSITVADSNNGTDVITACDSYTWIDSNTYTTSNNTATHILTNAAGCDSVVTLNLTVLTTGNFTASVSTVGYMLSAEPAGATYQWLDCDSIYAGFPPVLVPSSVPISGATNQDFTPTEIGNYAVVVSLGACTATSDCQSVTIVGLQENRDSDIHIHPNPTSGILAIEGAEGTTAVYNIYGELVATTLSSTIDISNAAAGIYLLKTTDGQGRVYTQRVVKE